MEKINVHRKTKPKAGRKKAITILCIVVILFLTPCINWLSYLKTYNNKQIYFNDTFSNGIESWNALDAAWLKGDKEAQGIASIGIKEYVSPHIMKKIKIIKVNDVNIVTHVRIKIDDFTNDSITIASICYPLGEIALLADKKGRLGISRGIFDSPIYSKKSYFNYKNNNWFDVYLYVNDKEAAVYKGNKRVLTTKFNSFTLPVEQIWLGAVWLGGAGNYGAPVRMFYDGISIGNKGLLPKLGFFDYTLECASVSCRKTVEIVKDWFN